ncbi:NAD(P)H-quinone oxidoreductase [Candidatus Spongiihabitans sp.]|uniref:NAD(P)H-quinone oxidoreductase n=1 Tax=Candidatus Spongiihabitans sp. TaxID=3101308 RepID=UPI003C6F7B6C
MKAILLNDFGGPEMMVFGDAECPLAGERQILIKVAATSVNRPDVIQRQGNYAPPKGESEILGLEVAGTVAALGAQVTQWKIGERVMALIGGGGYAEYAVAYADHAMAIPENMDFNQAACVCETYLTAYLNLFMIAGLGRDQSVGQSTGQPANQSVLLHGGGGGVNTAAIQLCKQLAPDSAIIVTASSAKVERVKQLGADYVIDYQNESFADKVKEITDQRGVDVILDHIGADYLKPNMQCLAVGGTLMLIGVMGGSVAELNLALAMVKRQRIIGSVLRSRPLPEKAAIIAAFTKTVLPLMANGTISPLISEVYPLKKAAAAHRAMENSSHFGKIVLTVA